MKHEWRKSEKGLYLPKNKPQVVDIPAFKFFTIEGAGNPNDESFGEYITVLYALSYGMKMGLKKGTKPDGYFDYTVYPLEGVWDISEMAKKMNKDQFDKNDLVFKLMIRQPDFVDDKTAREVMHLTMQKKPNPLLAHAKFEQITDGPCVQMMHIGSYDDEPASFELMEEFADQEGLSRVSKVHREIYISDFRKVAKEKLKTVLRFQVVPK